jgi:hypothetical protein
MFKQVPTGFWESTSNQRSFMNQLATKLNITSLDGWYNITGKYITNNGGGGLLKRYEGSISKLLSAIYPEYPLCMYRLAYFF